MTGSPPLSAATSYGPREARRRQCLEAKHLRRVGWTDAGADQGGRDQRAGARSAPYCERMVAVPDASIRHRGLPRPSTHSSDPASAFAAARRPIPWPASTSKR